LPLYCEETGLCLDSYLELSKNDEREIIQRAISNIRAELPELWSRVGPPSELKADDYQTIDDACFAAYEQLSREYRERGRLELASKIAGGDPTADNTGAEPWDRALQHVQGKVELHALAEFLLPTDKAQDLIALDVSAMSVQDLSEELKRWFGNSKKMLFSGIPDADMLHVIIALWTDPEVAVKLDWRSTIDVLLIDRPVARATRYLALKTLRSRHRRGT
jgi:hypothetical protein